MNWPVLDIQCVARDSAVIHWIPKDHSASTYLQTTRQEYKLHLLYVFVHLRVFCDQDRFGFKTDWRNVAIEM